MIKHAKNKQRQIIITLLDLKKNIFRGRPQNFIKSIRVSPHSNVIKLLITDYYKHYTITMDTNTYITDPLIVGKGVLQADCLNLLLFNMVINTSIKTTDEKNYPLYEA